MASELVIIPGAGPRRKMDIETTPGRCANLDYCSIGMQRVQVQVPISQAFVCPECGGPLRAPGKVAGARGRPWLLPAIRILFLVACVAVAFAAGYAAGHVQPAMHQALQQAGDRLELAGTRLGLKEAPPVPVAPAPVAPPPIFVAERAYPQRAAPVDTTNPPAHLLKEVRFGEVTIDCALEATLTHPVCRVTDIRGADAVSAAAIVWLQNLAVQYAPSERTGASVLLKHRWRVVFDDFSGVPKRESGR